MDPNQLISAWDQEQEQPFSGWDFSYLAGRMLEEHPPWDYMARAAALMREASSLLDMGTGGGERLLRLKAFWPGRITVTEDYPPNVNLARERFIPLSVNVVETPLNQDTPMPFANGEFDLILNRQSGLNCAEIARVLSIGGKFLTQQIHGLWAQDLLAAFGVSPAWPHETLERLVPAVEAAGLSIIHAEDWTGSLTFKDIGAIVYYLKAVPWLVPGFSVQTHAKQLLGLHERLQREGSLVFEARKFYIEAEKANRPGPKLQPQAA